jgi:hypothetical protein
MRGFEHRLLDVAEPSSKLSLEAYARMARDELASLAASEDALPVLVGGGRVRPVRVGWLGPDRDGNAPAIARARLPAATSRAPTKCSRLASEVARRVHPNNYEAILNALVRRMVARRATRWPRRLRSRCTASTKGKRRPVDGSRRRWTPRSATGCWRRLQSSTAGTGSSSRLAGQGVGATWRRRRMGIASSSAWPRRPGRPSRSSTAPTLLPPEPKRSATSGRTRDGSGRGSANLARRGSTIDQRSAISDKNHSVASAVTAPELEISLAQEQTTTCYADTK